MKLRDMLYMLEEMRRFHGGDREICDEGGNPYETMKMAPDGSISMVTRSETPQPRSLDGGTEGSQGSEGSEGDAGDAGEPGATGEEGQPGASGQTGSAGTPG